MGAGVVAVCSRGGGVYEQETAQMANILSRIEPSAAVSAR